MEDPGWRFWAGLAGVMVIGGIALFVFLLLLLGAVYAWGVLGAFLAVALGVLVVGLIYDRREARRHGGYQTGA